MAARWRSTEELPLSFLLRRKLSKCSINNTREHLTKEDVRVAAKYMKQASHFSVSREMKFQR